MSDNAEVCSSHFRSSDFITTLTGRRVLTKDAVPFEPVKSSALVAKKTSRKPPKDRTPVLTRQINGIESFLTCYFLIITYHLLVYLCTNHTDRYHSFFANMLHCYYLLPAGADQCVLSKKNYSVHSLQKGKM